jgi:DNA-directed RNA polymerase specialized sigma24 family protein
VEKSALARRFESSLKACEICGLSGTSVSATKSRVFHAKTALRKSKVLRRLHTRLDLQKDEIKEQEKNDV